MTDAPNTRKIIVNVDPQGHVTVCRSCGASIIWGRTRLGATCPADSEPVVDAGGVPHYFSHFETCVHARQHSQKAKRAAQHVREREQFERWNRGR